MIGFERPELLWVLGLAVPLVAAALTSRRRLGTGRKVLALVLRLALLLVLALGLSGLTWRTQEDSLGVVFAIDGSASVDPASRAAALDFVRDALAHADDDDRAGVVVFGSTAMLEAAPRADLELHGLESRPSPHQTNIAAGLRLSTAVLSADRARRVVLLSDGEQTRGDAAAQVLLTAGDELELAVVPLQSATGADVRLEDLLVPPRVDQDAPWEVRVVARSDEPATGVLRLYRNDQYLGQTEVALSGERPDVFAFRQPGAGAGLYRFRATLEVDATADAIPQNNEAMGTVQVLGEPRILYAEGYGDQAHHLRRVLEADGFTVDVVDAAGIPPGPEGLRPYAAVVLSDIPAYALTQRQQEALQSYVRDLGRGLIMAGGDRSFGLGGYYRTPVAEALPVRMDLDDKTPIPKLGMVIAVDKSGSMGGGEAGSKLAMAREAGIRSVELLSDRDMLGVIGFDNAASWVVPFQDLTHRQQVIDTIASIRPGGGTDIYPALEKGIRTLNSSDAALKHVIVLSDGMTASADFERLLRGANHENVTTTAIAVGSDADRHTMRQFAEWGGGNYYLVTDPSAIPAVFTRETLLATQAFLIEEPITVAPGTPSDLTQGIDDYPPLLGMVATTPRARATTALWGEFGTDRRLPLLVHGRYGLGRSVAWTSDTKARWSQAWLGSEAYTQLWSQAVRWAAGDPTGGNLVVDAAIEEGELVVTVDAFTSDGGFHNFLEGEARVVAPDLTVHPLPLRQVSPGRYQARLPVDQDGSWLAGVSLRDGADVVGQSVAEAVQPYSPEYRSRGGGPALLDELGRLGGGGILTDPATVFTRPSQARAVPHPLWPWLVVLAAFLLLADVASRRLALRARLDPHAVELAASVFRRRRAPLRRRPPRRVKRTRTEAAATPDEALLDEPAAAAPQVDPDSYAGQLLAAKRATRRRLDGDEDDA